MRPLLILRPEPGNAVTAARARALGLMPLCRPLFATEAVPWDMPAGEWDGLLLTSATTVRLAGALPDLSVHAVGAATAEAARAAGLRVATVGEGGVDDLLDLLPPGLRLLHLTGEEHRAPAAATATLSTIVTYRARPLDPPPPEHIAESVTLIHSPAAGARFATLVERRSAVRIAAISPAAAAACGAGWARIEAAEKPTDDALLFLAARLCEEGER